MTEEAKNADIKNCGSIYKNNMDSSSLLHSDKISDDYQTEIIEIACTPSKLKYFPAEQYGGTRSALENKIPSSSKVNVPSDLIFESQTKTNYFENCNGSRSLQQSSAHSPLLFTPVKGENNFSDGFSTPSNKFIPTSYNTTLDSSRKCIPVVFSTPSPKSANRRTLFPSPMVSVSSKKDRIPIKNEDSNLSSTSRSFQQRMRYLPEDNYSDLRSLVVEEERPLQTAEKNTELVITSPVNAVNSENLHCDNSLSPTPLQIKKYILEESSKDSIRCDESSLEASQFFEVNIQKTHARAKERKYSPQVIAQKSVTTHPYHRTKRRHRLRTLLSRVRRSLNGLPPPPSVTIPQLTVDDILEKLKGSGQDVFCVRNSENTAVVPSKNILSLFHPSATEKEIMHMSWPSVLDSVHPGICYNLGSSSETLEELCQQVREKYVGSETASSCNIWSGSTSYNEINSNRRKNGNIQGSSLARECYITRRRRAFSLASLSTSIPSVSSKIRKIIVTGVQKKPKENKPEKIKQRRESVGKKVTKKEDGNNCLSGKCFGEKEKNMSKLNSIRRTLTFDACSSTIVHSTNNTSNLSSSLHLGVSSLLDSTKRTLNFDTVVNPTDNSSESKNTLEAKVLPSVPRDDNSFSNISEDRKKSSGIKSVKELSEVHKKKLLWAVAEALRSRGLNTGHDKFKKCAIPLFRYCKVKFLNISYDKEIKQNNTGDNSGSGQTDQRNESTSDKMLAIALGFVDKIMNEMGVTPVVKQKVPLI